MSAKNRSYTSHQFYCMKCGNRGIDLMRDKGHQHGRFHRKKLYCIYCKQEVNHVECRDMDEIAQFQEDFQNGMFQQEAIDSINFIKGAYA